MKILISCDFSRVLPELFHFDVNVQNELNSIINELDYGNGLNEYALLYKVYPESLLSDGFLAEDLSKYYPRKKRVLINPLLEHKSFIKKDEISRIRLICSEILKGINRLSELGVKNFEIDKFHKDVKSVFYEKGWL